MPGGVARDGWYMIGIGKQKVHPSNPKKAAIDRDAWEATRQPNP